MQDFVEITSNDSWFKQHPEKIAGVEYETTSMFFPIMVKGTMEDVYKATGISKKEYTLEEIFEDDLIKGEIEREDEELKKAGWTRNDIQGVADFVTNKKTIDDMKKKRIRIANANAKARLKILSLKIEK